MPADLSDARLVDLLADDFAARFPGVRASAYCAELLELEAEARAWFDFVASYDEIRDELARLDRVFGTSSLVDLSRPDQLNLALMRTLARLSATWDDAHLFAGVALVALSEAAGEIDDDEAYALRYLAAGRDALRLADLVDAPHAQTESAAAARRLQGVNRLQDFVAAWREQPAEVKWAAKVHAVGVRLSLTDKRIEALHAKAVALGELD